MNEDMSLGARSQLHSELEHRGLWSTPRPVQLFEEQLERNLRRQRFCPPWELDRFHPRNDPDLFSARNDLDNAHEVEDYWLPEPPLTLPKQSNSLPYDFLDLYPEGSATLSYNTTNGNLISIHKLNLDVIAERSPVIAAAFEYSNRSSRLHLDLLSPLAAMPLLRYLYTGTYDDADAYSEVPTSLLLHCQLYFFASIFDMADLKSQACVNVIRQCEFACCSPDKPIDFCAAIQFCYDHVNHNRRVIDEILEYCVECFARHQLKDDQDFRALAFEHRPFYSDLARTCRKRGFQDDAAIDIIRLPYNPQIPDSYASLEDSTNPRYQDVVHHFHQSDPFEEQAQGIKAGKTPLRPLGTITVHERPSLSASTLKIPAKPDASTAEAPHDRDRSTLSDVDMSEDEGFQMVRSLSSASTATVSDEDFILVLRPAATKPVDALSDTPSDTLSDTLSDTQSHSEEPTGSNDAKLISFADELDSLFKL